jgi:hypothetical protein
MNYFIKNKRKMGTLRETASDEIIQKLNELTNPNTISVANTLLDRNFSNLTYLESTCLRDIFELDLNKLVLYFKENK